MAEQTSLRPCIDLARMKAQIDDMDYEQMLRMWRSAPGGSPWFIGEVGDYFSKVMAKKKGEISHAEQVAASKRIG